MSCSEEAAAVSMVAVLADDLLVETLRTGRLPVGGHPLVALLVRWRDQCRSGSWVNA